MVLTHAVICCFGTQLLARLQTVYVVLNVVYVYTAVDFSSGFVLMIVQSVPRGHYRLARRDAEGIPEYRVLCARQLHQQ